MWRSTLTRCCLLTQSRWDWNEHLTERVEMRWMDGWTAGGREREMWITRFVYFTVCGLSAQNYDCTVLKFASAPYNSTMRMCKTLKSSIEGDTMQNINFTRAAMNRLNTWNTQWRRRHRNFHFDRLKRFCGLWRCECFISKQTKWKNVSTNFVNVVASKIFFVRKKGEWHVRTMPPIRGRCWAEDAIGK